MRRITLLCLLLAFSIPVAAQERVPPVPMPVPVPELVAPYTALKTFLELSNEQLQSLMQINTRRFEAQRDVYRQIAEKQAAIDAALRSGSADARTIGQLLIDIHALRQTTVSNAPYRNAALEVLTATQKTRLGALVQAMQLMNTAYEAVSLNLIDGPSPIRIQPVAGPPAEEPPADEVTTPAGARQR